MNWIRANRAFNQWIVATLMVAGVFTFIEHTCHMDVSRLFALVCCCDHEEDTVSIHHHEGMGEEMEHHTDHGMDDEMGHSMDMHHGSELPSSCDHDQSDDHEGVHLADTCCLPAVQGELSPTFVRTVDHVTSPLLAVEQTTLLRLNKPPPLRPLLLSDPPLHLSWPPGYILFGAFLS